MNKDNNTIPADMPMDNLTRDSKIGGVADFTSRDYTADIQDGLLKITSEVESVVLIVRDLGGGKGLQSVIAPKVLESKDLQDSLANLLLDVVTKRLLTEAEAEKVASAVRTV